LPTLHHSASCAPCITAQVASMGHAGQTARWQLDPAKKPQCPTQIAGHLHGLQCIPLWLLTEAGHPALVVNLCQADGHRQQQSTPNMSASSR
jgi:hypothetical protein